MARWYGQVGFVETVETEPGVWEPTDFPRDYYGDVLMNNRRWDQKQDSTNDDLSLNNRISIVADEFVNEHLAAIKWVTYMGSKWKVTGVEIAFPRIILTIGGVYAETSNPSS